VAIRNAAQARSPTCTANFQQYSRAFGMYLPDYDETFPPWLTNAPYHRGELPVTTWDLLLQSYLPRSSGGRCPEDRAPAFYEFADGTRVWRSYSTPRNLIWVPDPGNPRASLYPMKQARVTEPTGTLMLIEKRQGAEVNGWPYPLTTRPRCWPCGSAIENYQQCAWERHGGWVHALFVDGHIRALAGKPAAALPLDGLAPSVRWPHLAGYVFQPGRGAGFALRANGDQFWEFCPIPGEAPNEKCRP
jgi:prepilin-type processing-associated H-X9-DG protein